MSELEILVKKIHESYFNEGVGKVFFEQFSPELFNVNSKDFLASNFRCYDIDFNSELMLCLPSLWENYSASDWLELIEKNPQRPSGFKSTVEVGIYSDIQFLCKWLEVDGFQLLINSNQITREDKLNSLRFGTNMTSLFVKSTTDIDLLEEGFFEGYYKCNLSSLKKMGNYLLKNLRLSSFPTDEDSVAQKIELAFSKFKNDHI
jgi:hypothetical protein